eukprot:scpid84232/ scgid28796/ Putative AC9 transposase
MRPLGIANDVGFRHLLGYIEPNYSVPSKTTVSNIMRRLHETGKQELQKKLSEADSIAITTDAWTSKAIVSFVTYTRHFITDDWELVSCVLETSRFQGSHTAPVNLAATTKDVLSRFKVPAKSVACLVHDEPANQMAASRLLQDENGWSFSACATHRLQTCIRYSIASSQPIQKLLAAMLAGWWVTSKLRKLW